MRVRPAGEPLGGVSRPAINDAGGILVPPVAVAAEPPTILITGASRGMGFEFTQQYAEKGWKVLEMRKGWSGFGFSSLYILLENKTNINEPNE